MFDPLMRAKLNEKKMLNRSQKLRIRLGRGEAVNLDEDCIRELPTGSHLAFDTDYNAVNAMEDENGGC